MERKNKLFWLSIVLLITILSGVKSEKLAIDTDAGADDAMAILLVLSACASNDTRFEVVGITCVYGNTELQNVEKNVLKTLAIANATEIPVYSGAHKPLLVNFTSDNHFGFDGFGDFNFTEKITSRIDRSRHAAIALIELARKYRGELSILVLGPPTNIAIAITLDPEFVYNVKKFYIMGGSISGIGNINPGVEFNFSLDPESNFIILNSTITEPSSLIAWETTISLEIENDWRKNQLGAIDSKMINFLNKAEGKVRPEKHWGPADPLTAAVMLWPELIKKSIVTNISPIVSGEGRGGLLVDYLHRSGKPNNVQVIQEVDTAEFKRLLMYYLS